MYLSIEFGVRSLRSVCYQVFRCSSGFGPLYGSFCYQPVFFCSVPSLSTITTTCMLVWCLDCWLDWWWCILSYLGGSVRSGLGTLIYGELIWLYIFKFAPPQQERPYYSDSTASRLLSEVKHCQARLVLRWGTTLESLVLFFCLFAFLHQKHQLPKSFCLFYFHSTDHVLPN